MKYTYAYTYSWNDDDRLINELICGNEWSYFTIFLILLAIYSLGSSASLQLTSQSQVASQDDIDMDNRHDGLSYYLMCGRKINFLFNSTEFYPMMKVKLIYTKVHNYDMIWLWYRVTNFIESVLTLDKPSTIFISFSLTFTWKEIEMSSVSSNNSK